MNITPGVTKCYFLKKWNELKDVKSELALRDWFYGTKISLSLCTSKSR